MRCKAGGEKKRTRRRHERMPVSKKFDVFRMVFSSLVDKAFGTSSKISLQKNMDFLPKSLKGVLFYGTTLNGPGLVTTPDIL